MIKISLLTPAHAVTGGIELLFQLCHELNKNPDIKATILFQNKKEGKDVFIKEYEKYNCPYTTDNQIPTDVYIFPEIWANQAFNPSLKNSLKVIFWESVDGYFTATRFQKAHNQLYLPLLNHREDIIHLSQSYYATTFLENFHQKCIYAGDYLNDDFFKQIKQKKEKKDQVLFNPNKTTPFFRELCLLNEKSNSQIKFIPIVNKTREEVIDLMSESKVYIDFGNHPGKDRIPREAAICGCCVLTNLLGSAGFYTDIPIPNRYKFSNNYAEVKRALDSIQTIFKDYKESVKDFDIYKRQIKNEKMIFEMGCARLIKEIEKRINSKQE